VDLRLNIVESLPHNLYTCRH